MKKQCEHCKRERDKSQFNLDETSPDRLHKHCKSCRRHFENNKLNVIKSKEERWMSKFTVSTSDGGVLDQNHVRWYNDIEDPKLTLGTAWGIGKVRISKDELWKLRKSTVGILIQRKKNEKRNELFTVFCVW